VKIEDFCFLLKRYSTKFEHYVICILEKDFDEEKTKKEWEDQFITYVRETELKDD